MRQVRTGEGWPAVFYTFRNAKEAGGFWQLWKALRSKNGGMVRAFPKIRAGNALMYYPESNVLVSRHVDPASKTPAFKSVLITVEAMRPAPLAVVG